MRRMRIMIRVIPLIVPIPPGHPDLIDHCTFHQQFVSRRDLTSHGRVFRGGDLVGKILTHSDCASPDKVWVSGS